MSNETTKFVLVRCVETADIEAALMLAKIATASLHGEDRVRIHAPTVVKAARREVEIDTTREVGQTLALIFGGYLRREYGDDAVRVTRTARLAEAMPEAVLA